MAKLTGQTIAASYDQLLIVGDADGISSSLQAVESADTGGSSSALKIATNKVEIIPGSDDANAFEVSKNDGTAVFTVNTSSPAFTLTGNATVTTSDNTDTLTLISTDADANTGPNIEFYRNSPNAADADYIGRMRYTGKNNNASPEDVNYVVIDCQAITVTDGAEDGAWNLQTMKAGALNQRIRVNSTETVINDDHPDVDFRVESDAVTNAFFVKGSDGFVGLNHGDPKKMLHIRKGDTDCMLILDTQDSASDKQICFAEDYGSGNTSDGQYWSVGVDASEGPDFVIAYDANAQPSMGGDDDKLRIYSTGATKISNSTVNTTASFSGIESNFVKTAGASATDDIFRGIKSTMQFNDSDASLQWLIGGEFDATCTATATDTNNATYGVKATSSMNGGNVDNNFGLYGSNQHDGGTTDFDQIGFNIAMGCDGGTVGRDMYGGYIGINTATGPAGKVRGLWINMQGSGVDATADQFFVCHDDQNDDVVAQITALAGVATFDSGDFSGAPDYAEYFESKDGKAITIGKTVKLDGDKIVACEDGDTPIGVVRPKASSAVVANAKRLGYQGKYLKSEYDEIILEDYTIKKWKESINKEAYLKGLHNTAKECENYVRVEGSKEIRYVEGEDIPEGKKLGDIKVAAGADSFYKKHEYHSDRIPDGITAPNDAETLTPNHKRKKLNPDFDPSLVDGYKSRAERDEWCLIGLLGQIPITKGQPLASNWIKMKDVSDTVEMYFVK